MQGIKWSHRPKSSPSSNGTTNRWQALSAFPQTPQALFRALGARIAAITISATMPSNMSAAVRVEGHSSKSAVGHATRVQLSTASVKFAAMRMKVVFTASKM